MRSLESLVNFGLSTGDARFLFPNGKPALIVGVVEDRSLPYQTTVKYVDKSTDGDTIKSTRTNFPWDSYESLRVREQLAAGMFPPLYLAVVGLDVEYYMDSGLKISNARLVEDLKQDVGELKSKIPKGVSKERKLSPEWFIVCLAILISVFLAFFSPATSASVWGCGDIDKMSTQQHKNLRKSYQYGKEDDLGYTLAAIAMAESSAGKYRLNYRTNDYGLYGINVNTVKRISNVDNYYETVAILQELIHNDQLGADYALVTLRWNIGHHNGDWSKAVMMYNAGNNWNSPAGRQYLEIIKTNVSTLKTCLPA